MGRISAPCPDFRRNEERYVFGAIRSTWISSTGDLVTYFESKSAETCGTTAAIGISNGTLAPNLGRVPILHRLLVSPRPASFGFIYNSW